MTFELPLVVPGVTVTFALVAPDTMVTLLATEATFELLLTKLIACPFVPAGDGIVTVKLPAALVRASGFGVSEIAGGCVAVIATVVGALLKNPSLTINCAT